MHHLKPDSSNERHPLGGQGSPNEWHPLGGSESPNERHFLEKGSPSPQHPFEQGSTHRQPPVEQASHNDKVHQARYLYMNGKTQKEIAQTVGVTERTIRNWSKQFAWEKLKQASYAAPAIICGNLCNQLVEMQNEIAAREPGKRFPTLHEAEITRKLVNCIASLKKYPSLPQNMQVLEIFRRFVWPKDEKLGERINRYMELFLEADARNGFFPYKIEYNATQVSPISMFFEESEPSGIVDNSSNKPEPEIRHEEPAQTTDNNEVEGSDTSFPLPEKTGNFPPGYPHEEIAEFNKTLERMGLINKTTISRPTPARRQSRNQPCECGSGKKYKHCHGKQSTERYHKE